MKSGKNRTSCSVVLVSALASLLVACVAPGDGGMEPQGGPEGSIPQPAPDGTAPTALDQGKGAGSQFATAPSISPATSFQDIASNGTYIVSPGNFYAVVANPVTGGWRVFALFTCTTYSVNFWNGTGFYFDDQTGNPGTIVYDQNHNPLNPPGTIFPGGGQQGINWNPVWFIKNC
ncbi:MAG TPA: hypothetical protein VF516_00755 [Kofleriaceae bacterium]